MELIPHLLLIGHFLLPDCIIFTQLVLQSILSRVYHYHRSMARRFHPDNNYGFDTIEMMTMINRAKEGLQDQLRKNDAVREEKRDLAAEDV